MDFARYDGFGLKFHSPAGAYNSLKPATDDYVVAIDLAFYRGVLSQDQRFFGDQSSLHRRIDTKRAARFKAALEFYTGLIRQSRVDYGQTMPCVVLLLCSIEVSEDKSI